MLGFIGGLISAAAAAIVAVFVYFHRRNEEMALEDRKLRNALYAELLHIDEHYFYASGEIESAFRNKKLDTHLRWQRFGEVISVKELSRFSVLGAREMESLLQIAFRIRNTDTQIDLLLGDIEDIRENQIAELKERFDYIRSSSHRLLAFIQQEDRNLPPVEHPAPAP